MRRVLPIVVVVACALAWAAAPSMTNLNPATRPSARTGAGVASGQFPDGGEVEVLFGGNALLSTNAQTWTFTPSANTWSQRTTTGTPSARAWHSVSWDEGQRRLVLFGGSAALAGPLRNDTFTFDPATDTWKLLTNVGTPPSARFLSHLVYVPHLSAHLLYAGATGTTNNAEATALDPGLYRLVIDDAAATVTWTTLSPSGSVPPGRASACFGYDRVRRRLVVYGGEVVNDTLADTWEYDVDGNAWVNPMATGAPTKRGSSVCTFDQRTGKLLLYGGVTQPSGGPIGEAWEYNPLFARWARLMPSPTPGNLTFAGATFSPNYRGMFFFGGRTSAIGTSQATWTFVANGTPQVSLSGQMVDENVAVTLAAAVTDVDPADVHQWSWSQDAGPAVVLSNAASATPGFTSPRVTAPTVLRFTVVVNDGAETATASANVTVRDSINEPPDVDAGVSQMVNEGAMATLTSSAIDPNGEALLRAWTQVSGPAVTFGAPTSGVTTVTMPRVVADSVAVVRFTATDTRSGSASADVTLTILEAINEPPTADAGPDRFAVGGALVDIDGSGSDPNSEPLTFQWTVVDGGPLTMLSLGASVRVSTPLAGGTWVLQLEARDPRDGGAVDQMVLSASTFDAGAALDAGTDAGVSVDGGFLDGGSSVDGGFVDGGSSVDGGAIDGGPAMDGGASVDGGEGPDAGPIDLDAGSDADAGVDGGPVDDAGTGSDAGVDDVDAGPGPRRTYSLGCGCSSEAGAVSALLGFLVLTRRRRRAGPPE